MTLFHWFIAETHVKTIGGEPDVTPICTNSTYNNITLIICKIRTERSEEECRLLYQYGRDFMQNCDSRFTLAAENQTVFLHLTGLTPVDSGSYTCECSHANGTFIRNLNITVEGTCLIHFHPFFDLHLSGTLWLSLSNITIRCLCLYKTRWECLLCDVSENEDTSSSTQIPQTQFQVSSLGFAIILTGVIGGTTVLMTGVILEIFYRAKNKR